MHYEYRTSGVCSVQINIDVTDSTIDNVEFIRGCAGNTSGISRLVKGMSLDEVIDKLQGTTCGQRPTSCPDQLSKALLEIKAQMEIE